MILLFMKLKIFIPYLIENSFFFQKIKKIKKSFSSWIFVITNFFHNYHLIKEQKKKLIFTKKRFLEEISLF